MSEMADVRRAGPERRGLEPYEHRHDDRWVLMERVGPPVLYVEDIVRKSLWTIHHCRCGFEYRAHTPA